MFGKKERKKERKRVKKLQYNLLERYGFRAYIKYTYTTIHKEENYIKRMERTGITRKRMGGTKLIYIFIKDNLE